MEKKKIVPLMATVISFAVFAYGCDSGKTENNPAEAAAGLVASLSAQQEIPGDSGDGSRSNDPEAMGVEYSDEKNVGPAARGLFADYSTSYLAVVLYDAVNLGGAAFTIWAPNGVKDSQISSLVPSGWNDRVRSYAIKGGCAVTLYENVNFAGASVTASRKGLKSGYVSSTTLTGASSIKISCDDTNDAAALAFRNANESGAALPIWDSWDLTESGMGTWDTSVSSMDVNTSDSINGQDMSVKLTVSQYTGDPLRVYFDMNTFPSDVNDKIIAFLRALGERPQRCSEPLSCYTRNAQCIGQAQFITSRQACWDSYRGQSYCNIVNVCVDPRTNVPIP